MSALLSSCFRSVAAPRPAPMAALVFVIVTLLAGGAGAGSGTPSAPAAAKWVVGSQQSNGAFFTSTQDADMTAVTLAAIVAGGLDGEPIARALDYLKTNGQARAIRGALTGRIIAGIVAGRADPRSFGGINYVAILISQYDPVTGAFDSTDLLSNLAGANGALAAKEPLPQAAVDYVLSNRCPDGGFGSQNRCASGPDVESTARAINVLVAAGRGSDSAVAASTSYLQSAQNDDGGFGQGVGAPTDASATGLAISAIWAQGQRPTARPWTQSDKSGPVTALAALQDPAGGFRSTAADAGPSDTSTVNALPGAARETYPIVPGSTEPRSVRGAGSNRSPGDSGEQDDDEDVTPAPPPASAVPAESHAPDADLAGDTRSSRTLAAGKDDGSFSPAVPYDDPTLGRQLFAVGSLIASIAMVGSSLWLFRYTRPR